MFGVFVFRHLECEEEFCLSASQMGKRSTQKLNNYSRSQRNSAVEKRPAGDVITEPVCLSGVFNKGTSNRLVKLT